MVLSWFLHLLFKGLSWKFRVSTWEYQDVNHWCLNCFLAWITALDATVGTFLTQLLVQIPLQLLPLTLESTVKFVSIKVTPYWQCVKSAAVCPILATPAISSGDVEDESTQLGCQASVTPANSTFAPIWFPNVAWQELQPHHHI